MPTSPGMPSRRRSQATAWRWLACRRCRYPTDGARESEPDSFLLAPVIPLPRRVTTGLIVVTEARRRPMTPEERNLVIELFDRLATLEDAQRDPDAERLIRDGLRQAPNASYALVQTVLVQDEALKRADARIRELEGEPAADAPRDNSFLGGVRDSLFGRREGRGSVPSVPRPEDARGSMSPAWRTGTPAMAPGAGAGMPMGA